MNNVLEKICAEKAIHLESKKRERSLDDLKILLQEQDTTRGFINALEQKASSQIALITEVKKA